MYIGKMLGNIHRFGRCRVHGHGSNLFCEVCDDIQGTSITRAEEKRKWKADAERALKELIENQIDIDPEFVKVLNDNFWELL